MNSRSRRHSKLPSTVSSAASAESVHARYLLVSAKGGMQLHPLPAKGTVTLGRARDCDIVLDYPAVSHTHARLDLGTRVTVTDLDSRNGIHVRGERVHGSDSPQELAVGESFALGNVSVLVLPAGAAPPLDAMGGARLRVEDPAADDTGGLLTAVSRTNGNVLIFGETGVGKEVLADRIHKLSARSGPLVAINCAALADTLLESELFGHEKGAFTGAVDAKDGLLKSASNGTVLLDEIGEMSPGVQAKILRVIETQTILRLGGVRPIAINVRFLAATHRDLLTPTEGRMFRSDLYHRLAGFAFYIPPLRERKHQIMRLASDILAANAKEAGALPVAFSPAAALAMQSYDWPGNVRELRNVVTRARVLSAGRPIEAQHVLFDTSTDRASPPQANHDRERIIAALAQCAGNQTRAARLLGIARTTLVQRILVHGIPRPRPRR